MKRHSLLSILAFSFLSVASFPLLAQTDQEMMEVFNWKFETIAPDSSFTLMEGADGWENPALPATLICMAMPANYDQVVKDLEALGSEPGQRVVEKSNTTIGGVKGLLMLLEFTPLAGTDNEASYSLMFVRPYKGFALLLTAQYPKATNDQLYKKCLASFATVRQISSK